MLLRQIAEKKAELDRLRTQLPHGLDNFNHAYDIELTYSSNAIEGNTLTAADAWNGVRRTSPAGGNPSLQ